MRYSNKNFELRILRIYEFLFFMLKMPKCHKKRQGTTFEIDLTHE
jgi:hypothetical protein